MDFFQTVISISIFITVCFFVILSTQLFFIFKELRKTVGKVNNILENIENVSDNMKKSVEIIENSVQKVTTTLDIFTFIKNRFLNINKYKKDKYA